MEWSVGISSVRAITTSPFMRLSARTVTFSLESSPAFDSPLRWFAPVFELDDEREDVLRVKFPPEPDFEFWFAFWRDEPLDLELAELPIKSFIMSETSSASAYLRRITSTFTSGVVSTSSCSITLSKKSIFDFEVITTSLLERSSARISTLPRMRPLSASETLVTSDSTLTGVWVCSSPRLGRRRSVEEGADAERAMLFACAFCCALPVFSSSFCDSWTIVSSAVLMSVAEAFFICRTNTFSSTGVAISIALAISSILLMFWRVSVTSIEFVRSNTCKSPSFDLKPSSAFCASSCAEIFLKGIIIDTTLPESLPSDSGSIISGMPCLRASLRGTALTNFSP